MAYAIRLARDPDIPAMHRIRLGVRENWLSDPARITADSYLPYIAGRDNWVAVEAGSRAIAGFGIVDRTKASIWALFVDPDHEGRGVGRLLHDRMVDEATRAGLTRMWLTTTPDTRAVGFYERLGWTAVGTTDSGEIRFERQLAPDSPNG